MFNVANLFKRWDRDTSKVIDFNGVWRNELGSEMTITVGKDGKVTGTYHPGKEEAHCQGYHELVGFVNQNLISFTVDFQHNHMITSWTGHYVDDNHRGQINTLWHLVKSVQEHDLPLEAWGSLYTGGNTFKRVG